MQALPAPSISLVYAVANRGELVGRSVTFTNDPLCQRQLVVLQDHACDSSKPAPDLSEGSVGGTFDTLARGGAAHAVAETERDVDEAEVGIDNRDALLKKLSRQMGRGERPEALNVDTWYSSR